MVTKKRLLLQTCLILYTYHQPCQCFTAPIIHSKPSLSTNFSTQTRLNLTPIEFISNISTEDIIFSAQSSASKLASATLDGSIMNYYPVSLLIMYFAGILTSVSPCSLGLLPLTMSYISAAAGEREDKAAFLPTVAFALGLASVFVGLGLSASLLGGVFGSNKVDSLIGTILLVALSSGVSIAMGLQMLNLINLPLPSFEVSFQNGADSSTSSEIAFDDEGNMIDASNTVSKRLETNNVISLIRTFLLGGSSALVASPCATPVLTSILAYVATSQNPALGAALLFSYTAGYSTLLLLIGATGGQALAKAQAVASGSEEEGGIVMIGSFVTPFTAAILIWYGTTGFLNAVFGDPSISGLSPLFS